MKNKLSAGLAAGLMALLPISGLPSTASAMPRQAERAETWRAERAETPQPRRAEACQAVFDANRTTIEHMAASGNARGVSRIFKAQDCPAPRVSVMSGAAEAARLRCHYEFPATIICTFGAR
jgi:hypothetical protein